MNNLLQDKLIIATTLDKQWSPSIYMQLDTAQNFVDFVPMLKPSNLDNSPFGSTFIWNYFSSIDVSSGRLIFRLEIPPFGTIAVLLSKWSP